jgi:hypothetical protein
VLRYAHPVAIDRPEAGGMKDRLKHTLQGIVVGAAVAMIIGFS